MKRSDIQNVAEQVLQGASVHKPPVPVERLARHAGAEVRYEPLDGELSGMLFQEGDRAIVGVNALHSKSRQRFTIAHELGHLQLHDRSGIHIDHKFRVRLRGERSSQAVDPEEIEANRFAAELLMPAAMIDADLDKLVDDTVDYDDEDLVRQLAERYEVSTQAMAFRLINLGYQE